MLKQKSKAKVIILSKVYQETYKNLTKTLAFSKKL